MSLLSIVSTDTLLPLSKKILCNLKTKKDAQTSEEKQEIERIYIIYNIITNIRKNIITNAELNTQTYYVHTIPIDLYNFYMKNKEEILSKLKHLFPDSNIEYKRSTIKTHTIMQNLDRDIEIDWYQPLIVIDWS